uniref:GTP-binding protein REM 1 n=1 Tax=Lonchura striata TaxID=40157 RepID=UPI000B4CA60D|nr:GTP-binding protein REM 1 [Lonchura striata domestica]
MTLNTQPGSRSPLRRRASTPLPRPGGSGATSRGESYHPQLGHTASEPGGRDPRGTWSPDSSGSPRLREPRYRVVLLGDPGVGKTSLVNLFAGVQERDLLDQHGGAAYERRLTVDGEETALLVLDTWESEQRVRRGWLQRRSHCLHVGNAYIIVYSVTDRDSFESASELRIQLRRARQAEDIPIILVGNKTDLVRCREVSEEEGQACAAVFDCKFIETSAALQHNVAELFEGVVRQIRLRQGGRKSHLHPTPGQKHKESLASRARHFLDRLVARNSSKVALKVRSKSCHDLSVL